MSDKHPSFKEWMELTLCLYGTASRRQGEAIARKDHAARRAWGKEAARHQTLMFQLISRIREATPGLGEDITKPESLLDDPDGIDEMLDAVSEAHFGQHKEDSDADQATESS